MQQFSFRTASIGRLHFSSRGTWAALAAAVVVAGSAGIGTATPLTIPDGDFSAPAIGQGGSYSQGPWSWTAPGGGDGTVVNGLTPGNFYYTPTGFGGEPQSAFISDSIAEQVGTVTVGDTYTINLYAYDFYGSSASQNDGSPAITVSLFDGSPYGTSGSFLPVGTPVVIDQEEYSQAATFTAATGTTGDQLWLELASPGGQHYATNVTGSATPEPATFSLMGLVSMNMLRRRRRV